MAHPGAGVFALQSISSPLLNPRERHIPTPTTESGYIGSSTCLPWLAAVLPELRPRPVPALLSEILSVEVNWRHPFCAVRLPREVCSTLTFVLLLVLFCFFATRSGLSPFPKAFLPFVYFSCAFKNCSLRGILSQASSRASRPVLLPRLQVTFYDFIL